MLGRAFSGRGSRLYSPSSSGQAESAWFCKKCRKLRVIVSVTVHESAKLLAASPEDVMESHRVGVSRLAVAVSMQRIKFQKP